MIVRVANPIGKRQAGARGGLGNWRSHMGSAMVGCDQPYDGIARCDRWDRHVAEFGVPRANDDPVFNICRQRKSGIILRDSCAADDLNPLHIHAGEAPRPEPQSVLGNQVGGELARSDAN